VYDNGYNQIAAVLYIFGRHNSQELNRSGHYNILLVAIRSEYSFVQNEMYPQENWYYIKREFERPISGYYTYAIIVYYYYYFFISLQTHKAIRYLTCCNITYIIFSL